MRYIQIALLTVGICMPAALSAQIEWSGIADVSATMGGEDSKTITNGISNRYPNVSLQNLHLFFGSQVTENFSFSGKLQYSPNYYGYGSGLQISFASINYDSDDKSWGISAGRVLTPFGLFPKRQHSPENLSFQAPLAYGYFMNVSSLRGYWPLTGVNGSYGIDDVGLTGVSVFGYQVGLKGYYNYEDMLELELMVSNEPVSGSGSVKSNGSISGSGRIGYRPAIWANFGLSGSYGAFMTKTAENSVLSDIEQYKHLAIGVDGVFAYSYFELSGEYIFHQWETPKFAGGVFISDGTVAGHAGYTLNNHAAYADLKIDIPQLPGLFVGARFDRIWFDTTTNPAGKEEKWDEDVDRYTGILGYMIQEGVLLKLVGFKQETTTLQNDPTDDAAAMILTISF